MKGRNFFIGAAIFALTTLSLIETFAAEDLTNRPFLAIWRDNDGYTAPFAKTETPFLRIAIWNDGRVIFTKDATKWNHNLWEGHIDSKRLDELKKAVEKTGAFELEGNCYLVVDAPMDCVMLDLDGKQQMLYWDEVERAGYGININPTKTHLKFKSCWKEVNSLALEAVPKEAQAYTNRFQRAPESWRLKRPIQSK